MHFNRFNPNRAVRFGFNAAYFATFIRNNHSIDKILSFHYSKPYYQPKQSE